MTAFDYFCANCKMRHDFRDQIQVRFFHPVGETYDTWVSGDEVLSRLGSEAAETRLKGLKGLNWQQIRQATERLPKEVHDKAERRILDFLADNIQENIGSNIIGDSLADAVRDRNQQELASDLERERWTILLYDDAFRSKLLELAWIQLEGSFPEIDSAEESDNWI